MIYLYSVAHPWQQGRLMTSFSLSFFYFNDRNCKRLNQQGVGCKLSMGYKVITGIHIHSLLCCFFLLMPFNYIRGFVSNQGLIQSPAAESGAGTYKAEY